MKINSKTGIAVVLSGILTLSPIGVNLDKGGLSKSSQTIAFAEADGIKVNLNGTELVFSKEPELIEGRTYVPMRAIFENLGAEVEFNDGIVTAVTEEGVIVKHQVGTNVVSMNDATKEFDSSSVIKDGSTLVPLRMMAESIGANVSWDGTTKTVTIEKNQLNDQGLYFDPYNEEEVNSVASKMYEKYLQISDSPIYGIDYFKEYVKEVNGVEKYNIEKHSDRFLAHYNYDLEKNFIPDSEEKLNKSLEYYKNYSSIKERAFMKSLEDYLKKDNDKYFINGSLDKNKKYEINKEKLNALIEFQFNGAEFNTYIGKITFDDLSVWQQTIVTYLTVAYGWDVDEFTQYSEPGAVERSEKVIQLLNDLYAKVRDTEMTSKENNIKRLLLK